MKRNVLLYRSGMWVNGYFVRVAFFLAIAADDVGENFEYSVSL